MAVTGQKQLWVWPANRGTHLLVLEALIEGKQRILDNMTPTTSSGSLRLGVKCRCLTADKNDVTNCGMT